MLTFSQEAKDDLISKLEAHAKADAFLQGVYFKNGKGCAVGCSNVDYGDAPDDHQALADRIGAPVALIRLEDRIFEGLSVEDSKNWPLRFTNAIPTETDLSLVHWKFTHWLLTDLAQKDYAQPVKKVIIDVANALEPATRGEEVDQDKLNAAAYAADAAAYAADAAAYAAADAAADAADYAAAAYAAARAAVARAFAAADAAADAKQAEYKRYADKIIELMEDCK